MLMGHGLCRVPDCYDSTNEELTVKVKLGSTEYRLVVCGMWQHYASRHGFQPTEAERQIAMMAGKGELEERVRSAVVAEIERFNFPIEDAFPVMYVERVGDYYNHQMGKPDTEWVNRMSELMVNADQILSMG